MQQILLVTGHIKCSSFYNKSILKDYIVQNNVPTTNVDCKAVWLQQLFNNNLGDVTYLASISRTVFDRIVFDYENGPTKITKHVGLEIEKTGVKWGRFYVGWMGGWVSWKARKRQKSGEKNERNDEMIKEMNSNR